MLESWKLRNRTYWASHRGIIEYRSGVYTVWNRLLNRPSRHTTWGHALRALLRMS